MHPKVGQAEQRCSLQPGMAKWTPAKPNAAFRTAHEGILNSAGFCSKGEFQTARDFLLSMRPKGVAVNVGPIKTRTRPPPLHRARQKDPRRPQTPSKRSLVEVDRKSAKHCLLGLVSAMFLARLQIPEFWDPGILTLRSPQTPSKRSLVNFWYVPGGILALFLREF